MFIRLIMYEQDDPRKCTAAKMIRDGNAKRIKHAADATLLLNPFAKEFLLPSDKKRARSITAVDCSWRLSDGSRCANSTFKLYHRASIQNVKHVRIQINPQIIEM